MSPLFPPKNVKFIESKYQELKSGFIYLDTETTGNGPDDRLCQIAFKPEGGQAVR